MAIRVLLQIRGVGRPTLHIFPFQGHLTEHPPTFAAEESSSSEEDEEEEEMRQLKLEEEELELQIAQLVSECLSV